MRTITARQEVILSDPTGYSVHLRVKVDRDGSGTFVDLSDFEGRDWIHSVEYSENVDSPQMRATITLQREMEQLSLATLRTSSKPNVTNPVLDIGRQVKVEVAIAPINGTPESYFEVFNGYIQDLDFGGKDSMIKLDCLDQGSLIMETFIETVQKYGSSGGTAVETVIQDILDDNMGGSAPTLYTPTSPSWVLTEYKQDKEATLVAIRKLANQIGWDLRYKWDSGTSAFRFTLFAPDRAVSTADRTFTADQYWDLTRASISKTQVRNRIKGRYLNSSDVLVEVIREDATSKTRYGTLYMEVTEAASSNIDSTAEMQTMLDAILADLKDPSLDHTVSQPYFPFAELGDYYTYAANGVQYDTDQSLAVVGITHKLAREGSTTTIQTRGKPSAGVSRWFELEGRGDIAVPIDDYTDAAAQNLDATAIAQETIIITYDDPRTMDPPINDWAYTECHIDYSSGFTPSASTLAAKGKQTRFEITGQPPGTTIYSKLIIVDESGNVAATSSQVSQTALYKSPYHTHPDGDQMTGVVPPNSDFGIYTLDETTTPPDYWEEYGSSVWGSSDDVYFSTAQTESGGRSVKIATIGSADSVYYGIVSGQFPVRFDTDALYEVGARILVDSTTTDARLSFQFGQYDKSKSLLSSSIVQELILSTLTANTWTDYTVGYDLNTSTRFGTFAFLKRLTSGSDSANLYVDRVWARKVSRYVTLYRGPVVTTNITGSTWTALTTSGIGTGGRFQTCENYRQNYSFNTNTLIDGEYTTLRAGLHRITGQIALQAGNLAAGKYLRCAISVNGTRTYFSPVHVSDGSVADHVAFVDITDSFAKGDVIALHVRHTDTSSQPLYRFGSYLRVEEIFEDRD